MSWNDETGEYTGEHRMDDALILSWSLGDWALRRRVLRLVRLSDERKPRHLLPEPWSASMVVHPLPLPGTIMEPVYYDKQGRLTLYSGNDYLRVGYISRADAVKLRAMQSAPVRPRPGASPGVTRT